MQQPLAAPLGALAAGIVAARHFPFTFQETLFSVVLLATLAWISLRLRVHRCGLAACLSAFVMAGAMLVALHDSRNAAGGPSPITQVLERESAWAGDPLRLRGFVSVPSENLGGVDRFVVEVEAVFRGEPVRGGVQVLRYRLPRDSPLQLDYGDRVEFLARVRKLRNFENPGSFDWVGHLNRQGIEARATVRSGVPILRRGVREGAWWHRTLWRARMWARQRFEQVLGTAAQSVDPEITAPNRADPAAAVLRAMLLGDTNLLDPETTIEFQQTGAYHALVVSGLNVGILAFVVLGLLRLVRVPRTVQVLIAMSVVAAYALLVKPGVPVSRASWMLAACLVTTLIFRQRRALNMIAGTAFCFLVADPGLLFDAGAQLSFLSVASIAGIAVPLLDRTLEPWRLALPDLANIDKDMHLPPQVAHYRVYLRTRLRRPAMINPLPWTVIASCLRGLLRACIWIAELAVVSLVVQACLALLMAAHFQRAVLTGVVANLAVIPLVSITVPAGLLALVCQSSIAARAALWSAGSMVAVVEWCAKNLAFEPRVPPPPLWLGIAFGLSLLLVAWSFDRSRRCKISAWTTALAGLALIMIHPFSPRLQSGRLELVTLDVGQGECLFLALPSGQTMLIDGGGLPDFRSPEPGGRSRPALDIGEAVVSRYLWSRSIRQLDVVAVTHADADHLGGIPAVLRNFKVREVWLGGAPAAGYAELETLARERGARVMGLHEGYERALGGVLFQVLGPPRRPHRAKSRNDSSLVIQVRYGPRGFLLTGDIELQREMELTGQLAPADVLKVAHHGSRTSSGSEFLTRVKPAFAVISAGLDNVHGHPHQEVLDRLTRQRVTVFRTDLDGMISFSVAQRRIEIETYRFEKAGRETTAAPALRAGR